MCIRDRAWLRPTTALVLGPLLFILYTADLGRIAADHGVSSHFYADDSQLYISANLGDASRATDQLACSLFGSYRAVDEIQ